MCFCLPIKLGKPPTNSLQRDHKRIWFCGGQKTRGTRRKNSKSTKKGFILGCSALKIDSQGNNYNYNYTQQKQGKKVPWKKKSSWASHHNLFKACCNLDKCKINNLHALIMMSIKRWKLFPTIPQCSYSLRNYNWQLDLIVSNKSYNFLYLLLL